MPAFHWRAMRPQDLPEVERIAANVHPDFFEEPAVFAERQRLYGAGTHLLEMDGVPAGYVLSHPWQLGGLPALNSLLIALPEPADTYYLHDLALLPEARGSGAAGGMVRQLLAHAAQAGFPTASLVAVNGSVPFWNRHGFAVEERAETVEKLRSYEHTARFMVRRF